MLVHGPNNKLIVPQSQVTDLFEDVKDGHVLYALLEELSGQSLRPLVTSLATTTQAHKLGERKRKTTRRRDRGEEISRERRERVCV